ncbi:hypothetical protein C3R44_22845, partial [Mycobacterium tuberculosis]
TAGNSEAAGTKASGRTGEARGATADDATQQRTSTRNGGGQKTGPRARGRGAGGHQTPKGTDDGREKGATGGRDAATDGGPGNAAQGDKGTG